MKYYILLCLLLSAFLISGCVQQPEAPPIEPPTTQPGPEEGIEQMPESELRELCERESWPLEGCSAVPDPKGRELCEKCEELLGYVKEQDIEQMPESELREICEGKSWPPDCSTVPDSKGREMCEKCKELAGEEDIGKIEPPDITQITFFEEEEGKAVDPDWSPDGSQIVFCLVEGETRTLYLINADGTRLTEIGLGFDPSWSPVEDKIAYSSNNQIYTMNSNGEYITQLTTEYNNAQPAWNPDGTKIAYAHYGAGKPSIWIMNADGTGKVQLTTSADGECTFPSFSYDGSKIVYTKGPIWNLGSEKLPKTPNEIWIINTDGSNKHQIYAPSDSYQWIFQRAWNKNDEILFAKSPLQERKIPEIGVINSDGTNPGHMFSLPRDSLGRPELFYLDPVWDNTGTKVVAVKKIIDGPQNIVTFSWEG